MTTQNTKRVITREQILNHLNNYHSYSQAVKKAQKQITPAPATTLYGIEASMPRGGGSGHSDPTFTQAVVKKADPYIERRIRAIKEIDRRKSYVYGIQENDVLDLWLRGLNNVQIAKEMSVSERTIYRYKNNIIDVMVDVI